MIRLALFGAALVSAPLAAIAFDHVCAPDSMIKVVAALDVPGAPSDHFVRVPKTLYRSGERCGRVEEAPNPVTGTHLLVVVAEPDVWIADLTSRRGNYEKDQGPTYYFRARIFGDPSIRSSFIYTLEFGCEREWLLKAGAKLTKRSHPELGSVDEIRFSEGTETVIFSPRIASLSGSNSTATGSFTSESSTTNTHRVFGLILRCSPVPRTSPSSAKQVSKLADSRCRPTAAVQLRRTMYPTADFSASRA